MENLNERLELIAEYKLYNIDLTEKMRQIISRAIEENDFAKAFDILRNYEDPQFVLTAETARMKWLLVIYANEKENRSNGFFYEGSTDYSGLVDKYLKTIMMLRRIELDFDNYLVDEAYEYLKTVSPEAIIFILSNELFEHSEDVATEVYTRLHSNDDFILKAEWLMCLYKEYKEQWMLDEINLMREQLNEQ